MPRRCSTPRQILVYCTFRVYLMRLARPFWPCTYPVRSLCFPNLLIINHRWQPTGINTVSFPQRVNVSLDMEASGRLGDFGRRRIVSESRLVLWAMWGLLQISVHAFATPEGRRRSTGWNPNPSVMPLRLQQLPEWSGNLLLASSAQIPSALIRPFPFPAPDEPRFV
jgi:hypothetical protein